MTKPNKSNDYAVGYKKPPKRTQFKPGQSGNPRGRPKSSKNFSTELAEELAEKIPVRENGKVKKVSKQRAMLKSLSAKAVQGDVRAAQALATLIHRHIQEEEIPEKDTQLLSKTDAEVLAAFEAEILRKNPPQADVPPVKVKARDRSRRPRAERMQSTQKQHSKGEIS